MFRGPFTHIMESWVFGSDFEIFAFLVVNKEFAATFAMK